MPFDSEDTLHDFLARTWTKERVRTPAPRNSFRFAGGHPPTTPANLFAPVISGIPTQGETLTTSTGTWSQGPQSFAYQWLRNSAPVRGATSPTYLLTGADAGTIISVQVIATNALGSSAPAFAKPVGPIANQLTLNGTPVTTATVGAPYTGFTITGMNGWAPYTYGVVSGFFPPGITMDGHSGLVAGTPSSGGTFSNIVLQVTDAYGEKANLAPFSITIAIPLSISGTPVTAAMQNLPYAGFVVHGSGGTPPYSYSVTSGSLPTGINLNGGTGAVSGTPTGTGTSSGIVITVTDALSNTANLPAFSIVVTAQLSIAGTPVQVATLNQVYAGFAVTASGGFPAYTYSLTGSPLPNGITLGSSSGLVTGTPTVAGNFTGIIITATDSTLATASLPAFAIDVTTPGNDKLDFSKTVNSQYLALT